MSAPEHHRRVILCGTSPENPKGGIGSAVGGFVEALSVRDLLYKMVPTYDPTAPFRQFLPAAKGSMRIRRAIREVREAGARPVVYGHSGMLASLSRESAILAMSRRLGAATMLHIHASATVDYVGQPVTKRMVERALRHVDVVCCLTPWLRDAIGSQIGHSRTIAIPNPLPPSAVEMGRSLLSGDRELGRPDHAPRVVCLSRLVEGKGIFSAIRCMQELPDDVRLSIGGDGPLRADLERHVDALGLRDRVEFLGWVSGEQKRELLLQADVLLAPTTNDSMPMAFLEANCHGVPVVALRWRSIADLVRPGVNGLLVDEDSPEELGAAVAQVLEASSTSMRRSSIVHAMECYSPDAVGESLESVITSL